MSSADVCTVARESKGEDSLTSPQTHPVGGSSNKEESFDTPAGECLDQGGYFLKLLLFQGLPLILTVYSWNQMDPLELIWFHVYTVRVTNL